MKKKYETKIKAFSVLEILIVLLIIGALIGLGVYSLLQLRRVLEADQATKDFISIIKETKNLAKNNSINEDTDKARLLTHNFGYKLLFNNNTISRALCRKPFGYAWDSASVLCDEAINLKNSRYGNILLEPIANNCNAVIFENLTEKMFLLRDNTLILDNQCRIKIIFADDTTQRYKDILFTKLGSEYAITAPN